MRIFYKFVIGYFCVVLCEVICNFEYLILDIGF